MVHAYAPADLLEVTCRESYFEKPQRFIFDITTPGLRAEVFLNLLKMLVNHEGAALDRDMVNQWQVTDVQEEYNLEAVTVLREKAAITDEQLTVLPQGIAETVRQQRQAAQLQLAELEVQLAKAKIWAITTYDLLQLGEATALTKKVSLVENGVIVTVSLAESLVVEHETDYLSLNVRSFTNIEELNTDVDWL